MPSTRKNHERETLKHSSIFSLFTSLSRVFGLMRDVLKAYAFGTGPLSVAFDIAFRLNNMLRNLVAEGALSQSFVPLYSKYSAEGKEKANIAAGVIIVFTALTMGIVTIVVIILLPYFLPLILAGEKITAEEMQLTIKLSQLLFPYLILMSVASLYMGIQYAHKIFWAASFGPALLNIVILIVFGAYAAYIRYTHGTFGISAIYVFSYATLLAAIVQVIFQVYTVHRRGLKPRYSFHFKHNALKLLGSMMLPAAFAASMQELGQLIDVYLATSLMDKVPEAVSALTYSHRLIQLPIGIFGVAVATASLPQLSRLYQEDLTGTHFSENLSYSIRLNLFFLLPAVSGLIVFSEPIIRLIFERGAFTKRSTEVTATALMYYAPGILAYSLQKLFIVSLYARMNTRTPAIITAATLVLNLLFSLFLMQYFLHGGLALGSALAAWCGVLVYATLLIKNRSLRSVKNLFVEISKIVGLNVFFTVILLVLQKNIFPTQALLQLSVVIPIAVCIYILFAHWARLDEAKAFFDLLIKLKKKIRGT
ncbi:MAG: Lipid II flippase MurJ [Turneriella sp.]|nr:Lipid II flippase MurJ [Turneriella sp.]